MQLSLLHGNSPMTWRTLCGQDKAEIAKIADVCTAEAAVHPGENSGHDKEGQTVPCARGEAQPARLRGRRAHGEH
ncbi:Uncharacterised protein [Mycobacteroides abscessus subsp. abscessus]|nr:Uncharacterised protein [Mycobacteroides abscessus subsp. abscessus]